MSQSKKKSGKNKPQINKIGKPKETTPELSDFSKKDFADVVNSTKEIVNSIKEKLDQQEIEDTIVDTLESVIDDVIVPVQVIEAVTETLEVPLIEANTQVKMEIDFDSEQTVDAETESSNNANPESLFEFIHENFEKTKQLTIDNTKEFVNLINQNTNKAADFNQQLIQSLNTQIETVFTLQKESLDKYKYWVSEMMERRG